MMREEEGPRAGMSRSINGALRLTTNRFMGCQKGRPDDRDTGSKLHLCDLKL